VGEEVEREEFKIALFGGRERRRQPNKGLEKLEGKP
jgi:hypothetical protein